MSDLWDYRECVWDYRESTWTVDRDLLDYEVRATDGSTGEILDVQNGPLGAYLVVKPWWALDGRRVVPAGLVAALDHDRRLVQLTVTREELKSAPECDGAGWNADKRAEHAAFYGAVIGQ